MFTKHILPCSFVTVDGTEILRTPKRRSSIARHSIPSTFFYGSAVCLLISQNINKKLAEISAIKVISMIYSTFFHAYMIANIQKCPKISIRDLHWLYLVRTTHCHFCNALAPEWIMRVKITQNSLLLFTKSGKFKLFFSDPTAQVV